MTVAHPDLSRVLSCTTLPTLPSVGLQVLQLTRNPNVSAEQIAKVIETDPALSAKVLKTVNSSIYALKDPCTTIRRSLGYLGLAAVKSLVLGFSLMDSGKGVGNAPGMDEYWKRTIYAASAARAIAQMTKSFDPDEAFTAALFQDLGALAMYASIPNEYATVVNAAPAEHDKHPDMERTALGFTHTEAGAALASQWRLPDRYVQAIQHHHDPEQADAQHRALVRCVALGMRVALTLTAPEPARHLAALLSEAQIWFNIAPDAMKSQLVKIGPAARELAKMFEKPIGKSPDIGAIMAQVNEALIASQLVAMRESAELRLKNESLHIQAYTDALTGLSNRKQFDELAARHFGESTTLGRPFALIMVDGDKFKSVNDTHGHHVGDAVLKELASRIRTELGERGTACRYGGEEFALLLPGHTLEDAAQVAESVRTAICGSHFDLSHVEGAPPTLPISASFGVSGNEHASKRAFATFAAMLESADKALYQAKHAGRNRVCTQAAPEMALANPKPDSGAVAAQKVEVPVKLTRLLLIEDDALAAKLLLTLLQKTPGVSVEWMRDGAGAIKRLGDTTPGKQPHVIITDLGLPDVDGTVLVRTIRRMSHLRNTPIVVVSASNDEATSKRCTGAGATAFLSKMDLATDIAKWIKTITEHYADAGRAALAA